jgi:hypothetical protein
VLAGLHGLLWLAYLKTAAHSLCWVQCACAIWAIALALYSAHLRPFVWEPQGCVGMPLPLQVLPEPSAFGSERACAARCLEKASLHSRLYTQQASNLQANLDFNSSSASSTVAEACITWSAKPACKAGYAVDTAHDTAACEAHCLIDRACTHTQWSISKSGAFSVCEIVHTCGDSARMAAVDTEVIRTEAGTGRTMLGDGVWAVKKRSACLDVGNCVDPFAINHNELAKANSGRCAYDCSRLSVPFGLLEIPNCHIMTKTQLCDRGWVGDTGCDGLRTSGNYILQGLPPVGMPKLPSSTLPFLLGLASASPRGSAVLSPALLRYQPRLVTKAGQFLAIRHVMINEPKRKMHYYSSYSIGEIIRTSAVVCDQCASVYIEYTAFVGNRVASVVIRGPVTQPVTTVPAGGFLKHVLFHQNKSPSRNAHDVVVIGHKSALSVLYCMFTAGQTLRATSRSGTLKIMGTSFTDTRNAVELSRWRGTWTLIDFSGSVKIDAASTAPERCTDSICGTAVCSDAELPRSGPVVSLNLSYGASCGARVADGCASGSFGPDCRCQSTRNTGVPGSSCATTTNLGGRISVDKFQVRNVPGGTEVSTRI